jgi:oxygen-dependent protoporphyrinogen oxidase
MSTSLSAGAAKHAVVVGAGIAGLTAGYDLKKAGYRVTVVEAKDIPGGRMAEKMEGSFMKYTGATGLFRFYADMWDVIAELGLSERLMPYPKMGSGIANNTEETYDLDFNQTIGMLKHPALSVGSRLRLASLIPDFVRARRLVNLIHTAADFDDESMAEYLTRKVGADFLENVVAVVIATYGPGMSSKPRRPIS